MWTKFRLKALSLVVMMNLTFAGCSSTSQSPSTSNLLWLATQNDKMVRSYTIDHANGSISPVGNGGNPAATGQQPTAIAVSPDRLTLFVANGGDNTISLYTIQADGTLNSAGPSVQAGNSPRALAVDPTYNLLFVADEGSDSIAAFAISPGLLTLKTSFAIVSPPANGGSGPVALAVSPAAFSCVDSRTLVPVTQKCLALYAANQTAGTITAYDYFVDSSGNFVRGSTDLSGNFIVGGTVFGSPYIAGTSPSAIAFSRCAGASSTACQSPGINGLFVANTGSNDVTVFSGCIQLPTCQFGESSPDGTLSQIGSSVPAGTGPAALMVDPVADFIYVVDSGANQISAFQYTPSTGALAPSGTTTASGTSVFSDGAITPNASNSSNARNWLVVTGAGTLSTFGTGSDGSLSAGSSGQFSGQPSAILIR